MQQKEQQSREVTPGDLALVVMQRADVLGGISEEPHRLTRRFATPAMRQASEIVAEWMRAAGMSVRPDQVGNIIGRYEGDGDNATIVLGSHIDTVRDAGKYDGPLGVLAAIACVERLHAAKRRLPFAIEVVAFADEEGLRYHTAYLGSKVFAGSFDPAYLDLADDDGITMRAAILAYGGDPGALSPGKRRSDGLLGYCEVHIEQGPVLEREGLPVGIVSAIAAQSRVSVQLAGEAGHAGTVPMEMRRDALCAAAELVLAVEDLAREQPGVVATVGQLSVQPGASNVIPGKVTLSLDARHAQDAVCAEALGHIYERATSICARRRVSLDWQVLQETPSVACSPHLMEKLARAIEACGYQACHLMSGAGHDAVTMSEIAPVAMLFVRCKGGISHNPAESVDVDDVAVAIEVMGRFLEMISVDSGHGESK